MPKHTPSAVPFSRALVIGASGGIGSALAGALETGGADTTRLSRRDGFDLASEPSIAAAAARFHKQGAAFDLIFVATGMLAPAGARPERAFSEIDPAAMAEVMAVNAIGPALCVKHFAPLMPRDRRSAFVAFSARVGSIGDNRLGGWMSYRASKAALNQVLRCAAIELKRTHPHAVVAALHPGTIETALSRPYARGSYTATADAAVRNLLDVIARLPPDKTGEFYDYAGEEIEW